jgi:cytochrome c oxidase subunit 2
MRLVKSFDWSRVMTSYMLLTGLGTLIYVGIALAETAIAGFGDARTFGLCAAQCREEGESIAGGQRLISANRSQSAVGGRDSQTVAAGRRLFERGCAGCHRDDSTGVGPRLDGLFGRPVQDPACGVAVVDESYLREAILNPSATVALGFAPVMPTFAGLLTEEELQALIEYLKSLSDR